MPRRLPRRGRSRDQRHRGVMAQVGDHPGGWRRGGQREAQEAVVRGAQVPRQQRRAEHGGREAHRLAQKADARRGAQAAVRRNPSARGQRRSRHPHRAGDAAPPPSSCRPSGAGPPARSDAGVRAAEPPAGARRRRGVTRRPNHRRGERGAAWELAPVSTAQRPRGDRGRGASPRREAPASVERPTRRGAEGARRRAAFGGPEASAATMADRSSPRGRGAPAGRAGWHRATAARWDGHARVGRSPKRRHSHPRAPEWPKGLHRPGTANPRRSRSPPSRLLLARITVGRLGNLARHARPPAMRPPAATPRGTRRVPASDRPGAPARLAPDALDRAPQAPHIAAMPAPLHP